MRKQLVLIIPILAAIKPKLDEKRARDKKLEAQ
jgi:hypothetical protein